MEITLPTTDIKARVLWGVGNGDLWVEKSETVLTACVDGILQSDPVEKSEKTREVASPKKKRRKLKKNKSKEGHFIFVSNHLTS